MSVDLSKLAAEMYGKPCPKEHLHSQFRQSIKQKLKRHYQVRCSGCGLFKIWKRKPKGMADADSPQEVIDE